METIKGKDFLQAVITMREFQKLRKKAQCSKEICERSEAKVDSMIIEAYPRLKTRDIPMHSRL